MIVLAFTIFLALFSTSVLSIDNDALGCYLYPNPDNDLYCADNIRFDLAEEDCLDQAGCDNVENYFFEDRSCSDFDECELVRCDVDCSFNTPLGLCVEQGIRESQGLSVELPGEAVSNEILQCSTGCCYIPDSNTCEIYNTQYQCEVTSAQLFGSTQAGQWTPFGPNMDEARCLNLCGAEPPQPPEDQVPTGEAGTSRIFGQVLDQSNNNLPLRSAQVFLQGAAEASTQTDIEGNFEFLDLPAGSYTITATKVNYEQEQRQADLVEAGSSEIEFFLARQQFQGIRGKVFLERDGQRQSRSDVNLFINGQFRGKSIYPDGNFEIRLDDSFLNRDITLVAKFQGFEGQETFRIQSGQATEVNPVLQLKIGECSPPNELKPVEVFTASHVPGEKKVKLEWVKPCPEVNGYTITRLHGGEEITLSPSPPATGHIHVDDQDLEWGQTYTYRITANFPDGPAPAAAEISITLGDSRCEDKFSSGSGWEQFCTADNPVTANVNERQVVYSCNDQNQVTEEDCAINGPFFCAPEGEGQAACKSRGQCSVQGAPFGLYYSEEVCYGSADPYESVANFCYYDYAENSVSSTGTAIFTETSTANQCSSCEEVESCFDYKSKGACEVNSCIGSKCSWVDGASYTEPIISYENINIPGLVTPETGAGYCVDDSYKGVDKCELCGPKSNIFENYFCTPEVCASLGSCFSNPSYQAPALSKCLSCPPIPTQEANCYQYQSELECTGGQPAERGDNTQLILSEDQCGWNRCSWQSGQCVKDGDGDNQGDCEGLTGGLRQICQLDNTPPLTTIQGQGTHIVSFATPEVVFEGIDERVTLGSLFYCLTSMGEDTCTDFSDFTEAAYPDRQTTVAVNLLSEFAASTDGESYRLKFFSKDQFRNQERVQEAFVFVDNVLPEFTIRDESETNVDVTSLTVYLEDTTEPMSCNFEMQSIVPFGDIVSKQTTRDIAEIEVRFDSLRGIRYDLNVTCTDEQGNSNSKKKEFIFDHEGNVDVVSPQGILTSKEVSFEVSTLVGATCQLHYVETSRGPPAFIYVTDFSTSENGLSHTTEVLDIGNRYPRDYEEVTGYLVTCRDFLSGEDYQEFANFVVDTQPAQAGVILREGEREETHNEDNWEAFFVSSVDVDFVCANNDEGFDCDNFYYCLDGEDECRGRDPALFTEYGDLLTLEESAHICYYATDALSSLTNSSEFLYDVKCGSLVVDGFGITSLHPEAFTYRGEQWAVSQEPLFDWTFFTRVNTQACHFDFSSGFDYADTPLIRSLEPQQANLYTVAGFPVAAGVSAYSENGGAYTVYVRCQDDQGLTSPEKPIHLEYDPSAPQIESFTADPDPVIEGSSTTLDIQTDDKTVCRYDDQSDTYETMRYAFPDFEDGVLRTEHLARFPINFQGLQADYTITAVCSNGAGLLSEPAALNLHVDYTLEGNIIRIYPSGEHLRATDITAEVETSKNAMCEYRALDEYVSFAETGGRRIHNQPFNNLIEKEYNYLLRCSMGGNRVVPGEISFVIDRTAPVITEVNDGNFTCGQPSASIMVHSNEANITTYLYEVFDLGQQAGVIIRNDTNQSNGSLPVTAFDRAGPAIHEQAFSGSVESTNPFELPLDTLQEGHKYSVRVQIQDAAGNLGAAVESNGFVVTSDQYSICREDDTAPKVEFVTNTSDCRAATVEMRCSDPLACSGFKYGQSASINCNATLPYNGQKLSFTAPGYVCYEVSDSAGNKANGQYKVPFADGDGDGVKDDCDQCLFSAAAAFVDAQGCADADVSEDDKMVDTDGDRLPDSWEKHNSAFGCELNYVSPDSDSNGVPDNLEDYDSDSYSNYDEYLAKTNPCLADAPLTQPDQEAPSAIIAPPASTGGNGWAWTFLLVGLIMVAGGVGYLIYYYRKKPGMRTAASSAVGRPSTSKEEQKEETKAAKPSFIDTWKNKFSSLTRSKAQRQKQLARQQAFSAFSQESEKIPHVEKLLDTNKQHLSKLQQVADRYVEHKDEIKPGLRPEEKSIFKRLEDISKKTETKDIKEVASTEEAKDIFAKLKKLAQKRKG